MTVAIRAGLGRGASAARATLATLVVAFAVTFAGSLVRHDYTNAWKFFLAGLLAPGLSQILFTQSIREVGASRTSVTVGSAPLFALAIAFLFLDEPVRTPVVIGALAIVAGGVVLVGEPDRPDHLRTRGLLFALGAAVLFAVRDNIVRALHTHGSPETVGAAAMLAGRRRVAPLDAEPPVASRPPPARSRRDPVRAVVSLSLRGVLPRPGLDRLAVDRHRVAVGRRDRRARLSEHRARWGGGSSSAPSRSSPAAS